MRDTQAWLGLVWGVVEGEGLGGIGEYPRERKGSISENGGGLFGEKGEGPSGH